jgi:hypothetical protein
MDIFSFEWTLNIFYQLAKCSGFVFISLKSSKSLNFYGKYGEDFLVFAASFLLGIFLLFYIDVYTETMMFIPSKIVEIGMNSMTKLAVFVSIFIKLSNWINRDAFIQFTKKLTWCNKKVILIFINIK